MSARWVRDATDMQAPSLLETAPAPVWALLVGLMVAWVLLLIGAMA